MVDENLVTVSSEEIKTISVEILGENNSVDLEFVKTFESGLSVHNSDIYSHPSILTALTSKADIEAGKGLSQNDLTNILKENYDEAFEKAHQHSNLEALDVLSGVNTGDQDLSQIESDVHYLKTAVNLYPKFCVNSGNIDSNGKADILSYSNLILKTKNGGTYKNIIATNAKGMTFELSDEKTLDMSSRSNGTYNVFINYDGSLEAHINSVFRQKVQPTNPVINDIWLNTSVEPLNASKYINSTWVEYDGVCLGNVVISSGFIISVKTYEFNTNGYYHGYSNLINIDRPATIIETYKNVNFWYRIWSDGWIEQGGKTGLVSAGATTVLTTFLKPFENTNYTLLFSNYWNVGNGTGEALLRIYEYTTSTFTLYNNSATSQIFNWYACGY